MQFLTGRANRGYGTFDLLNQTLRLQNAPQLGSPETVRKLSTR